MKPTTEGAAIIAATPRTEPQPSTRFRKIVTRASRMSVSIRQLTRVDTLALIIVVSCTIAFGGHARAQSTPISLHPDNPHYFLWRGKPTVLIGSGEHYGAVLNRPFDYVKYLDALHQHGLNHTRLFLGLYVEDNAHLKDGPQAGNTLDPAPGQLLCPFARSNVPGYGKGGNKFDLKRWDEAFFSRLKDFVAKAAQRGVVVEVNLFCPYYAESMWKLSPFNAANNVNDLGHCKLTDVFTTDHHGGLLAVQEAMVRRIVSELRDFDNIYYEICNEPYAGGPTMAWQRRIAEVIAAGEKEFPRQHLISQNIGLISHNIGEIKVNDPHPAVSICNFHFTATRAMLDAVTINYALNKPIGDNETGFRGIGDGPYRREAWEFILAGGALFSHLDYSFTVGHEDGRFVLPPQQWGGGSPVLREQLRILKDFIEGFDFIHMKPDTAVVKGGVPAGGAAYVLANSGESYAIYLYGGQQATLTLDVPAGRYRAEWVNTLNGKVDKSEEVTHGGGALTLGSPEYKEDVALGVVMVKSTPISLHPDNPHYLLWRGQPTVLVTSGEHYGAVMNAPFDYVAYLDELQSVGLNKTRIFSGVYCEASGDYGIKDNKNILAPDRGNLLCPYARSDTPGYANGGNKFDLTRWDEAYFRRLKDFVGQAGQRGIVVEFTFFCPYYFDSQWNLSPFNVQNNVNVNDIGAVPPSEIYTLNHPKLLAVQQALVRKIVAELKDADNVYYEICNEAYWNRTTLDRSLANPADPYGQLLWQHKIAETIVAAEKYFASKHLIAQCSWPTFSEGGYGTSGTGWKIDKPHPAVSIFNFHNVPTPEVVGANYGLNKVIAQDETCPTGKTTTFDYRRWAWPFLLAGGAIYDNLDYSFTVAQPKGEYKYWRWEPGETRADHLDGVSAITRKQLRILKDFMEGFDFIHMKPDTAVVKGGVPAGGAAYVLARSGEAYAIYLHGGQQATLMLDVPAGRYRAEWVNTLNGKVDKAEEVTHGGGVVRLDSPEYKEDVALRVVLVKSTPISLHPDNPHYFLWRGKPTVLIGSGEHYGAVLNRPFDYIKYLDTLHQHALNHTRLFTGLYVEDNAHLKDGQAGNTLDPAPGQLLCPFARSDEPGYGKGGNKFDLKRWDETFFSRLKDFVAKAAQRGVVVEVNLFCPYYAESMWKLSPFNAANNVNDLGHCKRTDVFTMDHHGGLLAVQEAMVRRIVSELRDFENIYYEICNEPYAAGPTMAWQHHIADLIVDAEKDFPRQHLISQNVAGEKGKVANPHCALSIFNFHGAMPEAVTINYALNKPIGDNETGIGDNGTGPRGIDDAPYRREAWEFILAGGALFSHLDYSFTVGHEDGRFVLPRNQWGGGSPSLREQLRILKDFIEGFDFIHLKPDAAVVKGGVPAGGAAYVLARSGEAYAIYLHGGQQATLLLDVPAGRYRADWVNTLSGKVDKSEEVTHGSGALTLGSPEYKEDVALGVVLVK